MRSTRILCSLFAFLMFVSPARSVWAQTDPAFAIAAQPYSAYSGGNIDKVDLLNGNLSVNIPLISYPQRGGKLALKFAVRYQSGPAAINEYCTTESNGSRYCWDVAMEFAHGSGIVEGGVAGGGLTGNGPVYGYDYLGGIVGTADGAVHQLGPTTSANEWCGPYNGTTVCYPADTWRALDGSGYAINWNSTAETVLGPNGTEYIYPINSYGGYPSWGLPQWGSSKDPVFGYAAPTIQDTNGSQIIATGDSSSGQVTGWTDSLGRTIPAPQSDTPTADDPNACPSVAPYQNNVQPAATISELWSFPGVNGGTYPVKFCIATFSEYYSYYDPADKAAVKFSWNVDELQSGVLPVTCPHSPRSRSYDTRTP